ncbi:MAG: FAD-dependent oxidoreductase [Pseudomonadota bacterium]
MTETYDLAVIGAGIAGLNALNAATEYLPRGARCVLIDEKDAAGGMWNTAYDFVRLHQPHPMFTVGDMKWDWRKPDSYLAARDEVQAHLAASLRPIADALALDTHFGHTVTHCVEVDTHSGPVAEVAFCPNDDGSEQRRITAKRAIYASGLNYRLAQPLEFSSESIVSIVPQTLVQTLKEHPMAPVIVVGGGKTGMDTALAVTQADPKRDVSLIVGRGTNFLSREILLPNGMKKWTSGTLPSRLFRDLATTFDGDNEDALIDFVRQKFSTDPTADNALFLYGFQSDEELRRIKSSVSAVYKDYLTDIADAADGAHLVMRGGARVAVPPNAIVVNCTGSFFRADQMSDPRPLLSKNGCILSLTPRDAFHFLTSVSGFLTAHLFFRNQLLGQGFYSADLERLFALDRQACTGASAALAYLNQIIALKILPFSVLMRCGLDMDRWYPLPRRLAGLLAIKRHAKADIAHCQSTLDRIEHRFGVKAAPLALPVDGVGR